MDDSGFKTEDKELWQLVASGITPLKSKGEKKPKPVRQENKGEEKAAVAPKIIDVQVAPVIQQLPPPPPIKEPPTQQLESGDLRRVDASVANKLKTGEYPIDATLDLHGRTQDEAFEALRYFIATAYSMGKRCVRVVTGKGVQGEGVLRSQFPRWLATPGIEEYILAFTNTIPQHGGEGAFYVLIRKQR